jgi:hypothetical protein
MRTYGREEANSRFSQIALPTSLKLASPPPPVSLPPLTALRGGTASTPRLRV